MAKQINKQIKKSSEAIKEVMQLNLADIADSIISQIIGKAKGLTPAKMLDATKNIMPKGSNKYKSDLKATLAVISSDALDQVRLEVPTAKDVKLMENEHRLLFGEFEELPAKIRTRIDNANQLIIGTQIADLEKAIYFQYNSSVTSGKGIKEVESDIRDKAEKYIMGNAIIAGATLSASNIVNDSRNAFFFTDDVLSEIEAFQFMNDSPVAAICKDLAGKYFPIDDPNHFRYTPPLHYNCTSWIRPVLRVKKGVKVEKLVPTKTGAKSIQFNEGVLFESKCNCGCA